MIPDTLRQALEFAADHLRTCAEKDRDAAMTYLNGLLDKVKL